MHKIAYLALLGLLACRTRPWPDRADLAVPDIATPDLDARDLHVGDLVVVADLVQVPDHIVVPRWVGQGSPSTENLYSIWGSGAHDIYIAGSAGALLHRSTGEWEKLVSPSFGRDIYCVWGTGADRVFLAGDSGGLFRSLDGGLTWTQLDPGLDQPPQPLIGIWGSGPDNLFVVGGNGTIIHSSDGGDSWTQQQSNVGQSYLYSIWGASPLELFAAGDNYAILHTVDAGRNWIPYDNLTGLHDNLIFVRGRTAKDVWVVGLGAVLRSDISDGGVFGWKSVKSGLFEGVWVVGPGEVYVNGDETTIYHTVDNGKTWQGENTASLHHLDAFWASSPDDIYATGEGGTILHRRP